MSPVHNLSIPEHTEDAAVSFIRQSYNHAKRHLHDGISVIRGEFIGICDKAETYFNIISQPVNNFLKDLTQIEAEFQQETTKNCIGFVNTSSNRNIVPLEMAMNGCMEENY